MERSLGHFSNTAGFEIKVAEIFPNQPVIMIRATGADYLSRWYRVTIKDALNSITADKDGIFIIFVNNVGPTFVAVFQMGELRIAINQGRTFATVVITNPSDLATISVRAEGEGWMDSAQVREVELEIAKQ